MTTTTTKKIWNLKPNSELRFEIQHSGQYKKQTLKLKLVDGMAEIFGVELVKNKEYVFSSGQNGALFTYRGCRIESEGEGVDLNSDLYQSEDSIMNDVLTIHGTLQDLRAEAEDMEEDGPRVAIVGPKDTGKSSVASILTAYAVRTGYEPIFVELDVAQGNAASTGSMSASQIDGSCLNAEIGLEMLCPITYFFGHQHPSVNKLVYSNIVDRLAEHINNRLESAGAKKSSGLIVNTSSWVEGREAYGHLKSVLVKLGITTVIVTKEKLRARLKSDIGNTVDVIYLASPPGVVTREKDHRKDISNRQLKRYFYGSPSAYSGKLLPASLGLKFDEIEVYAVDQTFEIGDHMKPMGREASIDQSKLRRVTDASKLRNKVLALVQAKSSDDVIRCKACVAGFVHVALVEKDDEGSDILTITAPSSNRYDSKYYVVGDITWTEM